MIRVSSEGRFVFAALLGGLLSACGGGGNAADPPAPVPPTPPPVVQALTLVSSTPTSGAVNVLRTSSPLLDFSTTLNAATITTANIVLGGIAGNDTIAVSVAGARVTVVPAQRLLPRAKYNLTASVAVRGAGGEQPAGAITIPFTTEDGSWRNAAQIEADAGNAFTPVVAFDGAGNAIAAWQQSDGVRDNIYAVRYTPSGGWGTVALVEINNAGNATSPQIAVDAAGNALVVWYQSDGTRTNIWANRYTAGTGWGVASLIESDNAGAALFPQISMSASGNAVAVWYQSDGARSNIWANRYTVGTGWGVAELIESDNAGNAQSVKVAVNAAGNATAVWSQSDGTRFNIVANRYTVGTGWGAATLIEGDNIGNASLPDIAMDPDGNAMVVWRQTDGTRDNIWANRYAPATTWGTAELIETDNAGTASGSRVVLDSQGNAIAIWQHSDGLHSNIRANRYAAGSGWGTSVLVYASANIAATPQISIDRSGNALAVWRDSSLAGFSIWAGRYVRGGAWETAVQIEPGTGDATTPEVAIDNRGNALAVWAEADGVRSNIWANRFD
jgi:hypothetical protein